MKFNRPISFSKLYQTFCWFMVALTLTFLASYHPLLLPVEPALAAGVCAIPGKDGVVNQSTIVNTYFPGAPNASASAGSTSLSIGTYYSSGANTPINPGDLLMIIQMQDAEISSTNSLAYGSGDTANGGSGQTSLNNSGKYEFVYATNSVPLTGGTLQFRAGGTGSGLVNSYVNANPTTTRGRRTFQVIRVQQYASLTLTSNITVPDWNGSVGGVLVFDVAGDVNFNGFSIDGSAKGFRGGYTPSGASGANVQTYVASAGSTVGGGKGEGLAGTPRYMWDGTTAIDLGSDQLPGGDAGRGAPSNGGGGGNDHNSGGAGGGNGGRGGTGGIGWQGAGGSTGLPGGQGIGGFPVSNPATIDRLIMGGGGGGGDANDQPNGVRGGQGGGIVLIRAGRFVGSGTIRSNGSDGEINRFNNNPDGAGGGGAGGTIALQALHGNLSGLTVEARGGNGGNTLNDNNNEHGPGGGGGGGVVVSYSPGGTASGANLAGGANGRANNGAGIPHGATSGTVGVSSTFAPTSLPPIEPGASCFPTLNVTKSEANPGVAGQRTAPGTAAYTIVVSNTGPGGAAGVQIVDPLPSGFSYASGATATLAGGAVGAASPVNIGSATVPTFGDFLIPSGGSVTLTFNVQIDAATPAGTYQNPAQVSYLDPTRTILNPTRRITPSTNALVGSNTTYENGVFAGQPAPGSNYDANSNLGEDVVITAVSNNPNVLVVKRITAINGSTTTSVGDNLALYRDVPGNPYDDNLLDSPAPDPIDTNKWPNPSTFLLGGVNGGNVQPNDEIEYTIYFLSAGEDVANNVLMCDRVPTNVTFNPTAFNTGVPADPNGISTADRGIVVNVGGNSLALTGTADGDRARYFPPGAEPSLVPEFSGINCNGANTNGAVVVNLGNLNSATAPGVPADSYGFVRFRAKVK